MRALFAAALVACAWAAPSDVVVLDSDNFDGIVGQDKPVFIKFFAPWCGHCKSMAPDWETTATTFKKDNVVIAEVNADNHRELATRFGVQGYPTLKWFPAGTKEGDAYSGGRSADDLVSFVNGKIGTSRKVKSAPSAVAVLDTDNIDALLSDPTKLRLVEFYAPWCGHCKNLAPTYEKVAAAFEGEPSVLVAKVDADKHRSLGERFGIQGFPTIKYIPVGASGKAEDIMKDYEGGRDGKDFVDFINKNAGTERTLDGGMLATAGRNADLDELAQAFMEAGANAGALTTFKQAAAALGGEVAAKADAYAKVAAKIVEKGKGYVAKEAARLAGMISSDSVDKSKRVDFMRRRNLLLAFSDDE